MLRPLGCFSMHLVFPIGTFSQVLIMVGLTSNGQSILFWGTRVHSSKFKEIKESTDLESQKRCDSCMSKQARSHTNKEPKRLDKNPS